METNTKIGNNFWMGALVGIAASMLGIVIYLLSASPSIPRVDVS